MAKVICTGVAGFVGSHIADCLIENGHEVIGIDNLSTGSLDNVNPEVKFYNQDIRDDLLDTFEGAEYVFHEAALARIQPSIENPVLTNSVNLLGTLNILENCRKYGTKIIFASSSSIFKQDKLPTAEDDETNPKSPYALQKLFSEQYIKLYADLYGVDYCILRYFNVYGPRQILEGSYAAVVGIFLQQKLEDKPFTIVGDGQQRRDFTHVDDIVQANLMAMDVSGTFNIGTGKNYSVLEIAEAVGGKDYPIELLPERQGEYAATLADNSKAREKGWQPTMDIIDWIKEEA